MLKTIFFDTFFDKYEMTGFVLGVFFIISSLMSLFTHQVEVKEYHDKNKRVILDEVVPDISSICVESFVNECFTLNYVSTVNILAIKDDFSRQEQHTIYVKPKNEY